MTNMDWDPDVVERLTGVNEPGNMEDCANIKETGNNDTADETVPEPEISISVEQEADNAEQAVDKPRKLAPFPLIALAGAAIATWVFFVLRRRSS